MLSRILVAKLSRVAGREPGAHRALGKLERDLTAGRGERKVRESLEVPPDNHRIEHLDVEVLVEAGL